MSCVSRINGYGVDNMSTIEQNIRRISKNDDRYILLSNMPKIQNGEVHLFVKSIFKRKRWFDKYIQLGYLPSELVGSHDRTPYGLAGSRELDEYKNRLTDNTYLNYSYIRIISNTVVKNNLWKDELYLGDRIIIYELDYDGAYIQLTTDERAYLSL